MLENLLASLLGIILAFAGTAQVLLWFALYWFRYRLMKRMLLHAAVTMKEIEKSLNRLTEVEGAAELRQEAAALSYALAELNREVR